MKATRPPFFLIGFQARFAELIRTGQKTQTLRVNVKRSPQPNVHYARCYSGLRTKNCQLLGTWMVKQFTRNIYLTETDIFVGEFGREDRRMTMEQRNEFAVADGFTDFQEMVKWFLVNHPPKHSYPWLVCVDLIRWDFSQAWTEHDRLFS